MWIYIVTHHYNICSIRLNQWRNNINGLQMDRKMSLSHDKWLKDLVYFHLHNLEWHKKEFSFYFHYESIYYIFRQMFVIKNMIQAHRERLGENRSSWTPSGGREHIFLFIRGNHKRCIHVSTGHLNVCRTPLTGLVLLVWRRQWHHRDITGSVVGLEPPVLLLQPLHLLHQRLVHGVLLDQAVDFIL